MARGEQLSHITSRGGLVVLAQSREPRCAGDASRDRATLAGFLATVGAGCDQQQRSELSLVEPLDSSILGHFSWLPGALVGFLLPMTVWGLCQG